MSGCCNRAWFQGSTAHGFDNNAEAPDISHVNVARYVEAADKVLDLGIATQPEAPGVRKMRLSLAQPGGFVAGVIMHGDGVLLCKLPGNFAVYPDWARQNPGGGFHPGGRASCG